MQGTLGLMKSHRETRPSLHITPAWSPRQEKTGGQGENPRALGCILLFMLAAQTILDRKKKRQKKKASYYSSTYAGCCLHTPPMP